MSSLAELDRSKVVELDFGSAEFRKHGHRHVAGWARRPPFYVLGHGPPQVIVGRYADVHAVFSDAERFASRLPKGPGYWRAFPTRAPPIRISCRSMARALASSRNDVDADPPVRYLDI